MKRSLQKRIVFIVVSLFVLSCYSLYIPVPEHLQLPASYRYTKPPLKRFFSLFVPLQWFNCYSIQSVVGAIITVCSSPSTSVFGSAFDSSYSSNYKQNKILVPSSHAVKDSEGFIEVDYVTKLSNPNSNHVNRSSIIYIHGGGFARGHPKIDLLQTLLDDSNVSTVYAIYYNLAPNYVFPKAVEQCVDVSKWIFDHSEELKIDRTKIQLVGDSAGGNLVINAAISLMEQRWKYPLMAVHAVYPIIQFLEQLPSAHEFEIDPTGSLYHSDMARYISWYLLGDTSCFDKLRHGTYLSPKVATSYQDFLQNHSIHYLANEREIKTETSVLMKRVSNSECAHKLESSLLDWRMNLVLTPDRLLTNLNFTHTFLYSCEVDVLRDDSFLFARLLETLKVSFSHYHDINCYHGSLSRHYSFGGMRMLKHLTNNLRKVAHNQQNLFIKSYINEPLWTWFGS